jgi:hypothetical protein
MVVQQRSMVALVNEHGDGNVGETMTGPNGDEHR